ncbi:MAG TPA: hypothetical protein VM328_09075, partial [Fimbriimonadaceae bacterium]|nr:hypothetical protein [Fimbriimonadaceae bacterium]
MAHDEGVPVPLETNAKPIGSAGLNAQKFAGAKIGAHRADPAMLSGASGGSTIGAMVQKALDPQSNAAEVKTESEFTPMIQRLMALAAGAIQGKEAGGQESEEKHSDAEEGNAGGDLEPKAHQAALEKRESATAAVAGGVSSISVGLLAIQAAASVTKSEIEKTKRRRAMEIASKVFSGLSIAASLAGTVLEQVKVATAAIPILGTVSGAMGLFDFLAKLIGGQANNPSAEDTIEGVKDDLPPMWGRWIEAHRKLVRRATIASNYLSLVSSLLGVAAGILTMTGVGAVALPVLGGLAFVLAGAALILNPVSIIGPAIKIYKTAKRVLQRARSAWEALTGTIKQKKQNFADYGKKMQEQYRQWAEAKKAELWSWILKKKDQLADTIREKAAWIAGLIRGKKDDLQGWISKKTSAIYKMLPAAAKRVWDWVAQKRDEVFAWIAERKAWLDQWAGVKRLMFQLWIEQKKQQAIQWILDKKDTIQEWLGAKKQSLLEWATERKNEFKEWFLDKYGSFKEWWGTKKGDLVGWADGKWHPKKPSSPKPGGAADSEPGETPTRRPRGGFGTRIAEMLKRSGVGRPVSPLGSVGKAALEMARRAAERGQGIVGRGLGLLGQGVRRVGQFVVQGAQRVGEFVGEQAQRAREGVGQVLGTVGRAVGQGLGLVGRAIGGVVGAGVERALEFGQEVGERVTRRIQGAFPRAANDGALTGPFMPGGVPVEDDREAEELHGSRTDSEARGAIGNGATIFVNGIDTSISEHFRAAQRLANQLNTPVVGVYNASTGFGSDLLQCFSDKMFDAGRLVGRGNPAVETLRRIMVRHGNPREENGGLRIFAHSQGSIIVSEALRQARGEGADISQHDVTTFGNAAFSFPTGPQYHHYVHDDDLVSTGVGTTSIVSRIMNQTWPGRFLRDRLLGPSTDPQASTVVMHQGGSFIRPHSVNDPSGTNDYIGNLPEFRRREGMGMPAGTAMPTTTRSLMATGFGSDLLQCFSD